MRERTIEREGIASADMTDAGVVSVGAGETTVDTTARPARPLYTKLLDWNLAARVPEPKRRQAEQQGRGLSTGLTIQIATGESLSVQSRFVAQVIGLQLWNEVGGTGTELGADVYEATVLCAVFNLDGAAVVNNAAIEERSRRAFMAEFRTLGKAPRYDRRREGGTEQVSALTLVGPEVAGVGGELRLQCWPHTDRISGNLEAIVPVMLDNGEQRRLRKGQGEPLFKLIKPTVDRLLPQKPILRPKGEVQVQSGEARR